MKTILVDYDNISESTRDAGISFLIERLLTLADAQGYVPVGQVDVRLYGGWYDGNIPTRRAQALSHEISGSFPFYYSVNGNGSRILVKADLARSLIVDPLKHFFHTYRKRRPPRSLACDSTILAACGEPDCPLRGLSALLTSGTCGHNGCSVRYEDLIFCGQQKLVDSMISLDLVHLAFVLRESVCLVSSDDDFWPAICTGTQAGSLVLHAQPVKPSSVCQDYLRGMPANYVCLPLYKGKV